MLKREEVAADWRRSFEGLRDIYCSVDHIKVDEMGGACGTHGGKQQCVQG